MNPDFNTWHFGFVGLGLIGGSIARAIRKYWPQAQITAYNPSRDSLYEAMEDGVVNDGTCREDCLARTGKDRFSGADFADCDVVFLCAPVQDNAENLKELSGHLKSSAILTDIGSTKRDIHEHVRAIGLAPYFVGGHPMTGSERTRYRNSRAELLENAYYLLAPEEETPKEKTEAMVALVSGIRAIPLVVTCGQHDFAVSAISHLPHVVSAALVNTVKDADDENALLKQIAAGGFKDITRISSSSPVMWQQICLTNKDNLLLLLDRYLAQLQKIRGEIEKSRENEIYTFFADAKAYRDSFTQPSPGAKGQLYTIYVDIEDRPAALAEVVTLLAVNAVSIKNVGITHNREYQEGVLLVEFYDAAALEKAAEILTAHSYTLHRTR